MSKINKVFFNLIIFFSYFIYNHVSILFIINMNKSNMSLILLFKDLVHIIFLLFIYRKELIIDLKKINIKTVIKHIPYYLIGIMYCSNLLISKITNSIISTNEEIVRKSIKLMPIYMSFTTVIYAPIVEEIIFRKTFKNIFKNNYLFIIISGIIFGFVHIKLSNNINKELLMTIPYIIMGIDLSYIYYKSDNIFTTMIIHSIHNFVLLLIQLGGIL